MQDQLHLECFTTIRCDNSTKLWTDALTFHNLVKQQEWGNQQTEANERQKKPLQAKLKPLTANNSSLSSSKSEPKKSSQWTRK